MIVDGFECEPLPANIDLSSLPPDKVLAAVVDGHLLWQGSAPTECLVLVTMQHKRRIEAQLAGRSDAATTTDDGDGSASDRTSE